tara:strand:- start:1517 stop:3742 length:2226 start_codon:yes stop_codon:yes gene_type:complete
MYKYIFLIFFLINLNLSAEIVKQLDVTGNKRISAETVKTYGGITLNKDYSNFDVDKILKNLYETNFFEDIKISLSNGILNIAVKEYSIINAINLEGEKSSKVKSKILKILTLQAKESFIESKLKEDIATVKSLYASIGYNFTTVEAKVERFENERVNLIFFLVKGKKTDIAKINFIGDKKIKEKRLRDVIVSEESKFWKFLSRNTFLNNNNIELDIRLLSNYYKSLGYYDVQVLSSSAEVSRDNFTTLTYTINAGDRYIVNKISTNVSEVLDKKLFVPLKSSFSKVIGKYYSPFKVKKVLDDLDNLIANNDLQFIEHSVNEILDNGTIEIKINIYEGRKQLVEKINILGNTVTNESVIRGELLLDEGDPFSSLKLDQTIARIKARNLFGEVKNTITQGSSKDQKIIEISVEEKPTGEISAGAGIGTGGGSFAFNVSENNWLGKGVKISTNIDVSKDTFSGGLSVVNPNYNFSGNSLTYHIQRTSNDKSDSGYKNDIISTGVGTRFEQYRNIYLSPALSLSYDDLKVQDSASEGLKKQKGTFTDLSFNYGILLDNRDRVYDPTDGYISSFSQSVPLYADSPAIRNTYNFSKYKAFSEDMRGAFKFYTSTIHGLSDKDVRINKRLNLSSSKLRGFENGKVGPKDNKDFVGGNYTMAGNFELSLPNLLPESTKTDVGLFLDLGNVWKVDYDSTVGDSNIIRSSAGVSTSWTSPVGPMQFVFAKNITKATTDVTEFFKFQLGTSF